MLYVLITIIFTMTITALRYHEIPFFKMGLLFKNACFHVSSEGCTLVFLFLWLMSTDPWRYSRSGPSTMPARAFHKTYNTPTFVAGKQYLLSSWINNDQPLRNWIICFDVCSKRFIYSSKVSKYETVTLTETVERSIRP